MLASSVRRAGSRCLVRQRPACLCTDAAGGAWDYDYDVLVVGGGIVGAALACKLAEIPKAGGSFKIGLVEGRAPPTVADVMARPTPDARVYTLAPSSVHFLDSVGAWAAVAPRAHAFSRMHVWDARGRGALRFDARTAAASASAAAPPALGHTAEHTALQAALFERLRALHADGALALLCPRELAALDFRGTEREPPGPMRATLSGGGSGGGGGGGGGEQVTARLVVAADGGASKVRRLRGLRSFGWGYGQRAVVCTVALERGGDAATAWQRYLPRGPLALLPLWDGFASVVWSTTPEEAEELKALPPGAFLERLNAALRGDAAPPPPPFAGIPLLGAAAEGAANAVNALASLTALGSSGGGDGSGGDTAVVSPLAVGLPGPRLGFDLSLAQSAAYTAPRVALVGDAAHTVHPMAGQGLNLGLSDAEALAAAIREAALSGGDIGSVQALSRYDSDRRMRNAAMLGGLDALHRVFATGAAPVALARNAGMALIDASPQLKAAIARVAMGV
ncbi:ubiquinone biosynthesis monooxygenase [Tribonema minus]|uniref:Ubiquinone biosynthesis monooxygenase COQ6, mitochondrial n=1 Tax=Tribonema minus TaxID=303371 RepID=A0A835Z6E6_9STRA|nr:ubiquinone biosynthesis monooxygenase [Tribonema minus]